ncbi:MAG: hypothetical protein ABJN69_01260 [Hellea sp.]
MFIKTIGITAAIICVTGAALLPANKASSENKPFETHEVSYIKPGAAVDLTHDYDGKTQKGEIEILTLTLAHIYEEGYLTVRLLPPPELQIHSDTNPHTLQIQAGSSFVLPVQLSSMADGTYYLGLETVYESLEGQQSRRVLSVPITVGVQPAEKSRASDLKDIQVTSEGIIALPAREIIK